MAVVVPQFLNDLPLLRDLNEAEVEHVSKFAARRMLRQDTVVQLSGEPTGFLGFLLSGRGMESIPSGDGRLYVTRRMRGGALFGERALVVDEPSAVEVRCLQGSEILLIGVSAFQELLPTSPRLAAGLARSLADRESALRQRLEVTLIPRGEDRVLAYLDLAARESARGNTDSMRALGLTHEQIAVDCGLSRETVSRILSRWRDTDG